MTLAEILTTAIDEYGQRNQLTTDQALQHLNTVQRMAFNKDLSAFLVTNQYLTVPPTTLRGPYQFPTDPPCRKMVGLTSLSEEEVLGLVDYQLSVSDDYDADKVYMGPANGFAPVLIDVIGRTFRTSFDLSTDADTYRIVYFRKPQAIRSEMDDTRLLIPEEFHDSLCVQGILALSDRDIFAINYQQTGSLEATMQEFWEYLSESVDPGNRQYLWGRGSIGL